jgi:dynein heavy chain
LDATLGKDTATSDAVAGKRAPEENGNGVDAPETPEAGATGHFSTSSSGKRAKHEEPLAYLEPKVMVPYEVPPGVIPRRVEIDRRKRLFAEQDVPSMLQAESVDPSGLSAFDIATFDNTDFEQRTAGEWVPRELPEGGAPAPAVVAFQDAYSGDVTWKDCTVSDFDHNDNTYRCEALDGGHPRWIHRVFVHFRAEDPFVYTRRLTAAVKERQRAEAVLRYNFFIDSMPTEGIPPLMTEQINRMLGYALNSKKLKDKLMDTSQLVNEINIEYARTMNKVVFDKAVVQAAAGEGAELTLPLSDLDFPKEPPRPVCPFPYQIITSA